MSKSNNQPNKLS